MVAKDYFAKAIDAQREVLAKNMGNKTDPNNIIVQQNGDALYFLIHDKDGNLLNNTSSFGLQGTQLSMHGLVQAAATIRDQDIKRAREKVTTIKPPKEKFKPLGNIGFGTAASALTSGDHSDTFVVKRDAVIHKGTLRLHGSNKRVPVNIPASMAIPFGGNRDIAVAMADHWNQFEGFTDTAVISKAIDGTTSSTSNVIGWGITQKNHPEVFAKMQRARSTQERVQINADFLGTYFSKNKLAENAQKAGIPLPSTAPYPKYLQNAYMLLADGTWHGGSVCGAAVASALSKRTYAEAEAAFKKTALFKAIPANHPRNQWNLNTLRQYYNSKALASGSSISLGGRSVKPVGNVHIPYRPK